LIKEWVHIVEPSGDTVYGYEKRGEDNRANINEMRGWPGVTRNEQVHLTFDSNAETMIDTDGLPLAERTDLPRELSNATPS
jgi:hypothetical protein